MRLDRLTPEQTSQGHPPNEAAPPSLLWSTVDLTRCCCSHEDYDAWMTRHGLVLGAAGVAHYLAKAAQVFEAQSYAAPFREERFDEWAARETFADRLMTAAPLSEEELGVTALTSIWEAHQDTLPATILISFSLPKGSKQNEDEHY